MGILDLYRWSLRNEGKKEKIISVPATYFLPVLEKFLVCLRKLFSEFLLSISLIFPLVYPNKANQTKPNQINQITTFLSTFPIKC